MQFPSKPCSLALLFAAPGQSEGLLLLAPAWQAEDLELASVANRDPNGSVQTSRIAFSFAAEVRISKPGTNPMPAALPAPEASGPAAAAGPSS